MKSASLAINYSGKYHLKWQDKISQMWLIILRFLYPGLERDRYGILPSSIFLSINHSNNCLSFLKDAF